MVVVDTNVLAALLLPTRHSSTVSALHATDPEWAAPPLWRSELRSVLVQQIRAGRTDRERALETLLLAAEVVVHELEPLSEEVLDLADASGCSAYDCEFVAVARALGARLLTFDRAVLRAFPDHAARPGSAK